LVYEDGLRDLMRLFRRKEFDSWPWFLLGITAERLANLPKQDDLMAIGHLGELWKAAGVLPYPHQLDAARRVIFELAGRAILGDEVGLGKTIEAGLIAKEYLLRRLARKVLILTPASLCWQWQAELREKFDITAWVARSEWDWERNDVLIASLDKAKLPRHRERILKECYDLVVIDEAHKLKNPRTQNWQLVNELRSKYLLMLTATPVQNDLKELYNLITLLKPGQLGTYREFVKRYTSGKREPRNEAELRELLRSVMIRNRRGDANSRYCGGQRRSGDSRILGIKRFAAGVGAHGARPRRSEGGRNRRSRYPDEQHQFESRISLRQ
jgi:SNF2 family DNA or RNA helicase